MPPNVLITIDRAGVKLLQSYLQESQGISEIEMRLDQINCKDENGQAIIKFYFRINSFGSDNNRIIS